MCAGLVCAPAPLGQVPEGSGPPIRSCYHRSLLAASSRVAEDEEIELKEAGGLGRSPPEARRDGREGFGKEEGD